MNRLIVFLLIVSMLLSLFSCAEDTAASETEAATLTVEDNETNEETATETVEPDPVYNEKVSEPLTPERIAAIPIANSSMTPDQLRQICVDYVKLSVAFQWMPNKTFSYVTSSMDVEKKFYEGKLYGGIPYVNRASGNIYRVMDLYDVETGIWTIDSVFANDHKNKDIYGTACSGTTAWGWGRVINSADIRWTSSLNVHHGLVTVGPYTYDPSIEVFGENGAEDCKPICKRNGKEVMYQSYALLQKGDCLVNQGHVRMAVEVHVEYNGLGQIDGDKSYVIQCEQGLWTNSAGHDRVSADGYAYEIQGSEDNKSAFSELFQSGYLPHTFKEFLGQDPVEPGAVTIAHSGPTATAAQLAEGDLVANYPISDVYTVLKNEQGEEEMRYPYRTDSFYTRSVPLGRACPSAVLRAGLNKGCHNVEILVRLSTGELVTAYSGELLS